MCYVKNDSQGIERIWFKSNVNDNILCGKRTYEKYGNNFFTTKVTAANNQYISGIT